MDFSNLAQLFGNGQQGGIQASNTQTPQTPQQNQQQQQAFANQGQQMGAQQSGMDRQTALINQNYRATYGTDAPPDQIQYWKNKMNSGQTMGNGQVAGDDYWMMRLRNPNYDTGPKQGMGQMGSLGSMMQPGQQTQFGMQAGMGQLSQTPNFQQLGQGGYRPQVMPQTGQGPMIPNGNSALGQIPTNVNDILGKIRQRQQQNQPLQTAIQGPNNPFMNNNGGV